MFRKRKVVPPWDDTTAPQGQKVKPTPQAPPPPTPPCTSKRVKKGAQRTKHPANEQADTIVAHDPQPTEFPPIRE